MVDMVSYTAIFFLVVALIVAAYLSFQTVKRHEGLFVICLLYILVFPVLEGRMKLLERMSILQAPTTYQQNADSIKMPPIDESMQRLIDEKIQTETAQIELDKNAKQAYQTAKDYLDRNYRGTQITSLLFDDKYEYWYEGIYLITFKVNVWLQNGSFLHKKFVFYMDKDETQAVDNVWKILDFKEENI